MGCYARQRGRIAAPDRRVVQVKSVNILGLRVDCVDLSQTLHWLERRIQQGDGGYVATPNVDYVMQARS